MSHRPDTQSRPENRFGTASYFRCMASAGVPSSLVKTKPRHFKKQLMKVHTGDRPQWLCPLYLRVLRAEMAHYEETAYPFP